MNEDARALAARSWFGYGRWGAPYWFVGMEPGGTDHPELYTSWEACGSKPLIDAKRHEDEWNARVPVDLQVHFFAENPVIQKGTWQPLIHILLGFTGSTDDPHLYQRDKLGRSDGDTAFIELSAVAAPGIGTPSDREAYREDRIKAIRDKLESKRPKLVVFYGTTYRDQYAEIAGGSFENDGFQWNGQTLCALIPHPARANKTYAYWTELGERMRKLKP